MPKIVDHEERRAHIVDALTTVAVRDGFNKLTMRRVAAEAGYAHGAIVRYFPNKQSLLTAAFLKVYTDADERIKPRVENLRGLAALEEMCREILPYPPIGAPFARVVISF